MIASLRALVVAFALASSVLVPFPASTLAATNVVQNGWNLTFGTPVGDGTPITGAYFNGTKVFASLTLPNVFVNYASGTCCDDNLGSGTTLKVGPAKTNVTNGFKISTTYCFGSCKPADATDAFSYKYVETYTFLSSGQWTANIDVYGPGLMSSATYEVFWRVDYDISGPTSDSFQRYNSGAWADIASESEPCDDRANATGGYEWRQNGGSRRYSVDPLSATATYCDLILVYHSGETGGTGKQYPGVLYDNNEDVTSADLVQWYHGFRAYSRPTGCASGGVGCTTPYPVTYRAVATGY